MKFSLPAIVLLCLAIFGLDWLTPAGYSVWPLYLIPVYLASSQMERRRVWGVAALCTALTILELFVPAHPDLLPLVFRRSVGIAVMWFIATLLLQRMRTDTGLRRRSDDELARAHARLRSFVEAGVVGVVVAKASGAIVEANDYYLRTVGYTRDEFENGLVDWRAMTPPEWLPSDERALEELRTTGVCTPYEKEYVRRDGSRVSVFLTDAVVPGPEKEIVAFVLDISERKQVEKARDASEERLRLFVEHAPASLAMFDRDMRYLSVSRRWMTDYRLAGKDLLGRSHYDVFPEIGERWKAIHRRALAGEVVRSESDRFDRLDGSVQWLSWEVRPWREVTGEIGGIVVFSEDVTERKLAEDALKESESKFRLMFTSMSEGCYIGDIILDEAGNACDFQLLDANPAYLRQTGNSAEHFAPVRVREAYPELESYWIERFAEVVRSGNAVRFEDYNRDTDRYYEVAAFAMGESRFGVVFTNTTERKRAAEKIARVQERLSLATRAARLGIWDWDVVHDQLMWDDRMYELYGVAKEDFGGAYDAWLRGIHPG